MTVALIDGDLVAYRASAAAQDDTDWGDGLGDQEYTDPRQAIDNARSLIEKWHDQSGCDKIAVCFSPPDSIVFRHKIGPYKEGRSGKPLAYWEVVADLEERYRTIRIPLLEADDVMGIMATSPKLRGSVIVSIDKDMKTIPAKVFNPLKDTRPRRITQEAADRFWMMQTLTGDRTDGYFGCPGIGPAKADKALSGCNTIREMWQAVVETYQDRGLTMEDALLQARFARILRREDYYKEKGTIYLWHPIPKRRVEFDLSRPSSE